MKSPEQRHAFKSNGQSQYRVDINHDHYNFYQKKKEEEKEVRKQLHDPSFTQKTSPKISMQVIRRQLPAEKKGPENPDKTPFAKSKHKVH
jgi:hypothetical protein